ncbi:MAG: PilZ domain-containing protein [Armatimonadetes bacterium]|nr:PilZ domain-containing protein [Armatimonadota bacterium]
MKTTSSWAVEITETSLVLSQTDSNELKVGAQVIIEVFGQKNNLLAHGVLTAVTLDSLVIAVRTPFALHPPTEQARASMVRLSATVNPNGSSTICNLMDVSLEGCAFEGPLDYERGQVIPIVLHTPAGDISGVFTVRNCRPKDFTGSVYRTGGTLEIVDRIAAARWAKVLAENICA